MDRSLELKLGSWPSPGEPAATITEGQSAYVSWNQGRSPLLLLQVKDGKARVMLYGPLGDDVACYELDPDDLGGVWQPGWQ